MSASAFLRALVSAAATGAACWLLAPAIDPRLLIALGAAAQLAATAPSRRRGLTAAALCGGLGLALLALRLPLATTALLTAMLFATCRSGILYRQRPARAAALEALLLAGGLALGAHLMGPWPSARSFALACWGFWLVQSAYFLVGGVCARADDGDAAGDPFERARSRILALLD